MFDVQMQARTEVPSVAATLGNILTGWTDNLVTATVMVHVVLPLP
jgi:hypothetical protein